MDADQPHVVYGQDLIDFLNTKNNNKKHPCAPDELFCCKCQRPSNPQGNTVSIKATSARTNLMGLCAVCGTKINKTISPSKIDSFKETFIVQMVHEEDLIECTSTSAITSKNEKKIHGQI